MRFLPVLLIAASFLPAGASASPCLPSPEAVYQAHPGKHVRADWHIIDNHKCWMAKGEFDGRHKSVRATARPDGDMRRVTATADGRERRSARSADPVGAALRDRDQSWPVTVPVPIYVEARAIAFADWRPPADVLPAWEEMGERARNVAAAEPVTAVARVALASIAPPAGGLKPLTQLLLMLLGVVTFVTAGFVTLPKLLRAWR